MLITFLLEFAMAFYVLWRYKLTTVTKIVVAMLFCLGVFQLAEYMICGGLGLGHAEWVQLGYVAITLLPALGIHLTATLAKKKARPLVFAAYATALGYVLYFIAYGAQVISSQCAPNYAIFDMEGQGYLFYGTYYFGWLLVTIALSTLWARQKPKQAAALRWTVIGYSAFIVPVMIANMIDPATIRAIPSIMCGFAIILAIVLVWRVMPLSKTPLRKH